MFINDVKDLPRLSRDEEAALAQAYQQHGDIDAMRKLVGHNSLFGVTYTLRNFSWTGLEPEDLICLANVGLIDAAKRFDGSFGTKFITYAASWIRRAILKEASNNVTIKTPDYVKKVQREVGRVRKQLTGELGRKPTDHEVAERSGLKISLIRELAMTPHENRIVSFSDRIGNSEQEVGETIVDPKTVDPIDALILHGERIELKAALNELHWRARTVLVLYFGLFGQPKLSFQEISELLNVTKQRVQQIFAKAQPHLHKVISRRKVQKEKEAQDKKQAELAAAQAKEQAEIDDHRQKRRAEREAKRKKQQAARAAENQRQNPYLHSDADDYYTR